MRNVVYILGLIVLGFNVSFAQNDLKSNQKIKSLKIIHKDFQDKGEDFKIVKEELYVFSKSGDTLLKKVEDEYKIIENKCSYFKGLKNRCVVATLITQANLKLISTKFYDRKGHIIKSIFFDSKDEKTTTNYNYSYSNYKTEVVSLIENGGKTSKIYNYDGLGNLLKIENIKENGESWESNISKYDVNGNLLESIGDFNRKIKYTYNNYNQLIKTSLEDLEYNYVYNTQGTLIEKREDSFIPEWNVHNITVFKYDSKGFLTKKELYKNQNLTDTTNYIYSNNKLTRIEYYYGTQLARIENIEYIYDSYKNIINETTFNVNKLKLSSIERVIEYF